LLCTGFFAAACETYLFGLLANISAFLPVIAHDF